MDLCILSHNDLDGIGCVFSLEEYYNTKAYRIHTSYSKLDEKLEELQNYIARVRPGFVYITDISLEKHQLVKISELARNYPGIEFIVIDHHPIKNMTAAEISSFRSDNLKIMITDKHSATKLTFLYLKSLGFKASEELAKFLSYINAYDIWLNETPEFKPGFMLSELFYFYGKDSFKRKQCITTEFYNKFSGNYKISSKNKEDYVEIVRKKDKLFKKLDESGRIMRTTDKRILMIFLDEYQSHLTIDYPGYKSYVIVKSYGGVSIRLANDVEDAEQVKNNIVKCIEMHDNVKVVGGHVHAFGTALVDTDAAKIIEFSRYIINCLDKEIK